VEIAHHIWALGLSHWTRDSWPSNELRTQKKKDKKNDRSKEIQRLTELLRSISRDVEAREEHTTSGTTFLSR
jgi:hypothetical protein